MLYPSYIKKLKTCPFCYLGKERAIRQNKNAMILVSRAPYTKDHLLVVPKKHILKLNSLNKKQKDDINQLIYYG